ncbi:hypothetical protein DERP_006240 [Dermatophagoides pteronyssinus]|uniref:Uncharacterized protein n=1 Tax=Dermatophagoides pteronyssinus TaxID=6956 RepID=A0ABQ8IXZ9_DERPT|nr:hypothetical protein DERP_006240 [Dermatophagoides pteronyssinus]
MNLQNINRFDHKLGEKETGTTIKQDNQHNQLNTKYKITNRYLYTICRFDDNGGSCCYGGGGGDEQYSIRVFHSFLHGRRRRRLRYS